MNRSTANDIIFGYEVAANHLEHVSALFEAIARLVDSDKPDLSTAATLARLGIDVADLAGCEAKEAGEAAERELQRVIKDRADTTGDRTAVIFDTGMIDDREYREFIEESPGFHLAAMLRELADECDKSGFLPKCRVLALDNGTTVGSVTTKEGRS